MAEPYIADIVGQFQRGQAFGTEQRKAREGEQQQSRLSELASLAYGAQNPEERRSYVGQAIGNDAATGLALGQSLAKDDENQQMELVKAIRLVGMYPEAQQPEAYRRVVGQLRQRFPGLPIPDEIDDNARKALTAINAAYGSAEADTPAGYRQLDLAAQAAGYKPGTPEYQNYFRVAGGIQGRAPSAGFGFETVPGVGITRRNPRTGQVEVYDQLTGDFSPIGTGASINAPSPQAQAPAPAPAQGGVVVTNQQGERGRYSIGADGLPVFIAEGVAPNIEQGITADPAAFQQPTAQAPAQFVGEPPAPSPAVARFGEITSRTPEQQAFLTEQEKERARLEAYDRATGSEVNRAAQVEFAKETAKAQAALQAIQGKKAVQANDVLSLLDSAEPLIKRSTGSGIGAAADVAAGFVGQSTQGADAIAALRPIAAALIGNVPRMEGPQSDADRRLYEQAAGDVANATIPQSQRLAAIQTMRDLQRKYASQNRGDQAPSTATPQPARRLRWNPQTQRLE